MVDIGELLDKQAMKPLERLVANRLDEITNDGPPQWDSRRGQMCLDVVNTEKIEPLKVALIESGIIEREKIVVIQLDPDETKGFLFVIDLTDINAENLKLVSTPRKR